MANSGTLLKQTARRLSPPLLWDLASVASRAVRSRLSGGPSSAVPEPVLGGEKDADFYDTIYASSEGYSSHYTASRYYFLWCVIADRIKQAGVTSILDIGCGPGQFAALLRDRGIKAYHGLDFSPICIERAKQACPEFPFVVADALETELVEALDYDAVVCTEFLEHVERDLDVLKRIRTGARVYGTVPNAGGRGHVRMFTDCDQVSERYASLFRDFRVDALLEKKDGITFFLFDGIKT